ncbi:MAG: hypothetical protein ACRC8U_09745 [Brooklawnia sp.]
MAMPSAYQRVGLPASSGYTVFNGLLSPVFAKQFVARLYAETIHGRITDQSVVPSELRKSGDLAIMRRAPRGQMFRYFKNQDLDHSTFNSETFSFRVDKAWYWNLKLDEVDVVQIPELKEWIKAFQSDSLEQLGAQIDHDVMQDMVAETHHCNKGSTAGLRSHSYNLGQVGAPLELTHGGTVNPLTLSVIMAAVLREQNASTKGMFIVWPSVVEPLFIANPILANAGASGLSRSTLVTGAVTEVNGVSHYFSANTPVYKDPVTGDTTYPVLMGVKTATGFVTQLTKTQVIDADPRSFARYWRGLQLGGWGVLRPELLAMAYVKVTGIF